MSLRVAVAAPFIQNGTRHLKENEFVVALSLDRDWFSPDQAKRLIDIATQEGLLEREDDGLAVAFDPSEVTVPEEFVPDEDLLQERSAFERVLDSLVAEGMEKHEAVGAINTLQQELGLTIEAAAVVYARRRGVDVEDLVPIARSAVLDTEDGSSSR
ncbi:DUF2240 family protein [Natrinema salsiterrestre]|uniref:DUF2240 family protein n=1 Tax=Natrinema salsiterrestre TaxID=2950540 RepID=A0A9Q4KWQ4_9EURY|nr:DUF2240 family protein [Natrinema salsiterrestre]MDF9744338.1 DUF2240 family protein [Natrinema salsiterrestre]